MASTSTDSTLSSSSTGRQQTGLAMLESVETAVLNAASLQGYRTGDMSVQRAPLQSLDQLRQRLLYQVELRQRTRALVSACDFSGADV